jgi:hypothetical protein
MVVDWVGDLVVHMLTWHDTWLYDGDVVVDVVVGCVFC